MEFSPTPHPDNFRTPLYPLFLVPFVAAKTNLYTPVIIQNLIFALGLIGYYLLSRRLFPNPIALLATAAIGIEPMTALISSQVMTEPLFTTLFTISILCLAVAARESRPKFLIAGATLLGLSALTKPVALYIGVIIPITILLMGLKQYWKQGLLALTAFFIVISPWAYYSKFIIKTNEFSSLGSFDLYAYHGVYFDTWRAERGATDRLPELDLNQVNNTFDARPIALLKSIGIGYIKSHFGEYLAYHTVRLPYLFLDSGLSNIANGLNVPGIHFDLVDGKYFYRLEVSHPIQTVRQFTHNPNLLLLLVPDLLWGLLAVFAFINPIIQYRLLKRWPKESLIIVAVLLGYTILASPIGGARLRIPINFLLFIVAFDSLSKIYRYYKPTTV